MSQYQNWELTPNQVVQGLLVSASTLTLTVAIGVARVDSKLIEVSTPVTLTADAGATQTVFINPAKDYDGNSLSVISFTKEPDHQKTNINGSIGYRYSRSLPLAKIVTSPNTGTVTLTGTWSAADTITVTVGGTAVVTTLDSTSAASLTAAAAAVAAAINANLTAAAKTRATSALGVVTLTAVTTGTVSAYTLTAADTGASGTATALGANLGGATSTVDNTVRENFAGFIGMRSELGE